MECLTGSIKIKDIFLHNGNWWKFFLKHPDQIRISIVSNVLKLLVCRTEFLGYHSFVCPNCNESLKVPHSCKSRFCTSCGKKATDDWIKNSLNSLPRTTWQHDTFTMPADFQSLFWHNRYLFNIVPGIAADIIKKLSRKKDFLPGIYLAIHTFGRDLKRNFHIHLSATTSGLSLSRDSWVGTQTFFYHNSLKNMWRYSIISLLRKEFKQNRLKLPPHLRYIKSYENFCAWTSVFYDKTWMVHLNKPSSNMKLNVDYLGKYLKRPPIGETRIKDYDGKSVTFEFLDHYTKTIDIMILPVLEFISRLISHIPDKNFRNIRYYGFLSNRLRGKLLPIVYNLLKMKTIIKKKVCTPWRDMIKKFFNYDPLKCPICDTIMILDNVVLPYSQSTLSMHKEIANGYFKLL